MDKYKTGRPKKGLDVYTGFGDRTYHLKIEKIPTEVKAKGVSSQPWIRLFCKSRGMCSA